MPNHNAQPDNLPQKPPILVETPEALAHLVERLTEQPRIAIDTESNSLYAYKEQVCLIQISVPDSDYLVDPFALEDLSPLGPILASTEIEKIFHAADYDLIVLQRDYGFTCGSLFDTMWAARILGWPRVGLANLLEEQFGVHVNKKFQRYNWGRRPLDAQAVRYARMDTHYLLELREIEAQALRERGRWQEAQEVFDYLRRHIAEPPIHDVASTFWRIKGLQGLSNREKHWLYQLHWWREATAERLDRPSFKVLGDRRLVALARSQPRSRKELKATGLTHHQVRRFGRGILNALRTKTKPLPPRPQEGERPPDEVVERYNVLHGWRKQVAAGRGVDSDVILPNATLWALAWHPPTSKAELIEVPGIGPWRQETYGADILALVGQ
ncbi:MAG: ribonuclease D [Anaerolineales bacterium]